MLEGDTIILKPGGIPSYSWEYSGSEDICVSVTAVSGKMWQGRDAAGKIYTGHLKLVEVINDHFETSSWRQS